MSVAVSTAASASAGTATGETPGAGGSSVDAGLQAAGSSAKRRRAVADRDIWRARGRVLYTIENGDYNGEYFVLSTEVRRPTSTPQQCGAVANCSAARHSRHIAGDRIQV